MFYDYVVVLGDMICTVSWVKDPNIKLCLIGWLTSLFRGGSDCDVGYHETGYTNPTWLPVYYVLPHVVAVKLLINKSVSHRTGYGRLIKAMGLGNCKVL